MKIYKLSLSIGFSVININRYTKNGKIVKTLCISPKIKTPSRCATRGCAKFHTSLLIDSFSSVRIYKREIIVLGCA